MFQLKSLVTPLRLFKNPSASIQVTNKVLNFHTTERLFAEPLKKKKRLDPAIIKAREDRKKKKLEKSIRRLEKHARQLKPIEECEVPLEILDGLKERQRVTAQVSEEEINRRVSIFKKWSQYKQKQHLSDVQMLDRISYSQQKALDELRKESKQLYQEAIQLKPMLLPLKIQGPSETPAIKNYNVPDGDYQDVSKKWD